MTGETHLAFTRARSSTRLPRTHPLRRAEGEELRHVAEHARPALPCPVRRVSDAETEGAR